MDEIETDDDGMDDDSIDDGSRLATQDDLLAFVHDIADIAGMTDDSWIPYRQGIYRRTTEFLSGSIDGKGFNVQQMTQFVLAYHIAWYDCQEFWKQQLQLLFNKATEKEMPLNDCPPDNSISLQREREFNNEVTTYIEEQHYEHRFDGQHGSN